MKKTLAQILFESRAVRGKLIVTGISPNKTRSGHNQVFTKCECGEPREVDVAEYNRGSINGCFDCMRAAHRQTMREASQRKCNALKEAKRSSPRASQVEMLLAQRIAACERLGVPCNVRKLRMAIIAEVAEADFSELLRPVRFALLPGRNSSLTAAVAGGSGL